MTSLTGRPPTTKQPSEPRVRWAIVVCDSCDDGYIFYGFLGEIHSCDRCDGTGKLKMQHLRFVPGSGPKTKSMTTIRRTKQDAEVSQSVRERDNHRCRKCGSEPNPGGLHAAHIFSRRHKAIRHDEQNLVSLCAACHRRSHDHPDEFRKWVIEQVGHDQYELLRKAAGGKP